MNVDKIKSQDLSAENENAVEDKIMKWELTFVQTSDGYESSVPKELQPILAKHPHISITYRSREALQLYSQTQVDTLERIAESSTAGRHAARLLFSNMASLENTQYLLIPPLLAAHIEMDKSDSIECTLLLYGERLFLIRRDMISELIGRL